MTSALNSLGLDLAQLWLASLIWLGMVVLLAGFFAVRRPALRVWLSTMGIAGLWLLPFISSPLVPWHFVSIELLPPQTIQRDARATDMATDSAESFASPVEPEESTESYAPVAPALKKTIPPKGLPTTEPGLVSAKVPSPMHEPARNADQLNVTGEGPAQSPSWPAMLAVVWMAGSLFFTFRLLVIQYRLHYFRQKAPVVREGALNNCLQQVQRELGLTFRPELRSSEEIAFPVVCGIRKPCIIVPATWRDGVELTVWPMVFHHECAHIVRRDLAWKWVQCLTDILWWPQPLLRIVQRLLADAREIVCDSYAIAFSKSSADYVEAVVGLASKSSRLPDAAMGIAFFGGEQRLHARLKTLLDPLLDRRVTLSRRGRTAMVLSSALMLAATAGVQWRDLTIRVEANETAQDSYLAESSRNELPAKLNPGVVHGVVRDAKGKPVADAEVRIWKKKEKFVREEGPPRTTHTDASGSFALGGFLPGAYDVIALKDELASRTKFYRCDVVDIDDQKNQTKTLSLILRPAVALRVVARDREGKIVNNAFVTLRRSDIDKNPHKANEDGTVIVPGLTTDHWDIEVAAPGHARVQKRFALTAPETKLEVNLEPGGYVAGTVVDESGTPIPKVTLYISAPQNEPYYETVLTDDQGRFKVDNLPLQKPIEIQASMDGYRMSAGSQEGNLTAALPIGASPKPLVLRLRKVADAGTVFGRVLDKEGKPIPNVLVENRGTSSSEIRKVTTNANGEFRIADLYEYLDGPRLFLRLNGYVPRSVIVPLKNRDGVTPLDIVLEPGKEIRGRIVNARGVPVPFSLISVQSDVTIGTSQSVRADFQGRFTLESPGANATFRVSAPGYAPVSHQSLSNTGEEFIITLEPGGNIRGMVVDSQMGHPIPEFTVQLNFPTGELGVGQKRPSTIQYPYIQPGREIADRDGQFAISGLENNAVYDVVIRAEGYRAVPIRSVFATYESKREPLVVRMDRLGADSLVVRGRLLAPSGNPVGGTQVRLLGTEKREGAPFLDGRWSWYNLKDDSLARSCIHYGSAVTNGDGSFEFREVPKNLQLAIAYWGEEIPSAIIENLDQRSDSELQRLEIVTGLAGSIRGTVDFARYPDATRVSIHAGSPVESQEATVTPQRNTFELKGLLPGRYTIQLYGGREPSTSLPHAFTYATIHSLRVTVRPDQTSIVHFDANADVSKTK
jgi:beta-lactamase regulating signal transducer with metallopeptidase domain/protocatechuate 3,4-dioxygenase beta subunit